jgi:predicted DNA-binding WGR domain protein
VKFLEKTKAEKEKKGYGPPVAGGSAAAAAPKPKAVKAAKKPVKDAAPKEPKASKASPAAKAKAAPKAVANKAPAKKAAAGAAGAGDAYLTNTEGNASKFWSITLNGCDTTVVYGKIGTDGMTQNKSHDSEEKAQKFVDKQISDKQKKGYC